ncbi:hypothetical protein CGCTS75_v009829 [Colletotrichum tropicale]|nr:hypothetical protein CGCTS75_v009829 [Colletotrichum tropicale]
MMCILRDLAFPRCLLPPMAQRRNSYLPRQSRKSKQFFRGYRPIPNASRPCYQLWENR